MHVVLISACEKRAIKKTRAVLDSYALRHGDHTWMTRITTEGLSELRRMLRRTATRQTSVACYQNDGRKHMRLLWIIGNQKNFDRFGVSPVGTRRRKESPWFPDWARTCAILAAASGYLHDLGKFGQTFQDKLRSPHPLADPVRHEWISFLVTKGLVAGKSWKTAWKDAPGNQYRDITPFDGSLTSAIDTLYFLIASHHRLLGQDGGIIGTSNHIRPDNGCEHVPSPVATPSKENLDRIHKLLGKVRTLPRNDDPLYWRGIGTVARMALILADHSVSAQEAIADNASAYANTLRKNGELKLNQSLDWHLEHVGTTAGGMVARMLALEPPWLSLDTLENLDSPAAGRYAWQNTAADALRRSAEELSAPHLVLNMAGTGSGKTRMNVRALAVLSRDRRLRVATALNLRTLTLQTADAYAEQLDMGPDELACVLGDVLTAKLHEWQKGLNKASRGPSGDDESAPPLVDDDENAAEAEIDARSDFEYTSAPDWLQHFLKGKPKLAAVIGAPVLVSTVDFLIAAGEPHRQGHHVLAMLRLMTSDLILDEIDGYDPKALVAVLRLVMMAAFWGRNVVASSATLSRPVAESLWRAYAKGMEMRAKVTGGTNRFVTAIIDDLTAPMTACFTAKEDFLTAYEAHLLTLLDKLKGRRFRVPFLMPVEKGARGDLAPWHTAILKAIHRLHQNNAWADPASGKRISFGLVRVANITGAVRLAGWLAGRAKNARVVCYHSQHFVMQRFHIEATLDHLLNRKQGDQHITAHPEVRAAIARCEAADLMFIVVATPVEEIGRDHDFDWAVIEPSSTQSIVQTAGRVNRHRLIGVSHENIAILQFNRKELLHEKRVFRLPGLEVAEKPYPSHDMRELLDWSRIEQIDARLRFDARHKFAALDDASLVEVLRLPLNAIFSEDRNANRWMGDGVYRDTRLREESDGTTWIVDDDDQFCKVERCSDGAVSRVNRNIPTTERHPNDWLVLDIQEVRDRAANIGMKGEDALSVSIRESATEIEYDRSFGWWYRN